MVVWEFEPLLLVRGSRGSHSPNLRTTTPHNYSGEADWWFGGQGARRTTLDLSNNISLLKVQKKWLLNCIGLGARVSSRSFWFKGSSPWLYWLLRPFCVLRKCPSSRQTHSHVGIIESMVSPTSPWFCQRCCDLYRDVSGRSVGSEASAGPCEQRAGCSSSRARALCAWLPLHRHRDMGSPQTMCCRPSKYEFEHVFVCCVPSVGHALGPLGRRASASER